MKAAERPVLRVENLVKRFPTPRRGVFVHAVNDVSFTIDGGEILAMVGESGSGKSTIGRALTHLIRPTAGRIWFGDRDIGKLTVNAFRPLRRHLQIVFQDPLDSLNPRLRVQTVIEEPLKLHTELSRHERRAHVEELATRVNLSRSFLSRFPHELSGGQLQRVCIARAIATNPSLVVLDEPTSSLDLSVRAGILKLLLELRRSSRMAMLLISHDLATVRLIADRVIVLYLGKVVEVGPTHEVFENPTHPYTQALMSAHLPPNPKVAVGRHLLEGEVPSAMHLPPGCLFVARCPAAIDACRRERPPMLGCGNEDHRAACLRISDGGNIIRGATLRQHAPAAHQAAIALRTFANRD